jgi:uncharacterized protein YyaL (SSP411 family)
VAAKKKIFSSLIKLEKWVEDNEYKSYEPSDGLSSYLKFFTFNRLSLERALQQFVKQSPINIRPLFGIKKQESTKGRGYMASGYLTLYKLTREKNYAEKASLNLDWLAINTADKYNYHCWGNHFDFSNREGKLPKFEPVIVWTSLIGQAFLNAYKLLKKDSYLQIAQSICNWILRLPREMTDSGNCLSSVAYAQRSMHYSNMLGAAMLARTAKYTKEYKRKKELLMVAKSAMQYSCTRQLADGTWWYGEAANFHSIDNFHTGYNLDSLKCYLESTTDKEFEEHLVKGFNFFINNFFEENGIPKYYPAKTFPIDSQCASQAIETLANFSDYNKNILVLATRVADWTIENMQDKKGYFYYRRYPFNVTVKTPMLHWAQATTYKGLALLLSKLNDYA